jgi:hypothetical protein
MVSNVYFFFGTNKPRGESRVMGKNYLLVLEGSVVKQRVKESR